uniref:Tubby-like F-box protein n=1 Tax=Oryza brachyantha TaxID=4533 RepID=J3MNW2_ORYBR
MSFRSVIQEVKGEIGAISRRSFRSRPHRAGRVRRPGPRDAPVKCFISRNRTTQTYYLYIGLTDAISDDGKFLLAARKCRRTMCTEYLISLDMNNISKGSETYIGKLRSNFLGTKFTVYDAHPPYAGDGVSKSQSERVIDSNQVTPRVTAGNYPVSHISYALNVLGSRGPRRMHCVMDSIPVSAIEQGGTAPTQTEFPSSNHESFTSIPFFKSKSFRVNSSAASLLTQNESKLVLKNKSPRWHEHLQCWCLNFHGRVTVASVKNFQLVASDESGPTNQEHEDVILQFGKVGKDTFTMDYRYPISAFQAFAICLSSFDTKIACE